MEQKTFDQAIWIKSEIKRLNNLLDNIRVQAKKCKDKNLEDILTYAYNSAFDAEQKMKESFNDLKD